METLISQILSGGDINAVSLLILFILGLLTRRFVPWWVHEDVVKKLDEYEEASPDLLEEVRKLMKVMNDPDRIERVDVRAPNASEVNVDTDTSHAAQRPRSRPRSGRRHR